MICVAVLIRASDRYQPFLGTDQFLYMLLHLVPFEGVLWKTRYPELAARFSNWTLATDPPPLGTTVPLGNSFETNAVVNFSTPRAWACRTCPQKANTTAPGWVSGIFPNNFEPNASNGMFSLAWPWTNDARFFDVKLGNVKLANPGFVSEDPGGKLDFALRPDSPLFKLGWQAIPEHDIGPSPSKPHEATISQARLKTDDPSSSAIGLANPVGPTIIAAKAVPGGLLTAQKQARPRLSRPVQRLAFIRARS